MALCGIAHHLNGGCAVVRHDAAIGHFATQSHQQRAQEKTVAVVDRTGRHVLGRHAARHDQFITRGKQGHARLAGDLHLTEADAGRQAQRRGCEAGSALQHRAAVGDVFTRAANPLIGLRDRVDAYAAVAQGLDIFLHHDRIRTRRNRRAGEDARHRARGQFGAHMAGGNALTDRQNHARGLHFAAAHGIAIHRRIVERWNLQLRHRIGPEHAPVGIEGVHGVRGVESRGLCQHGSEGVIQRHEVGLRLRQRGNSLRDEWGSMVGWPL